MQVLATYMPNVCEMELCCRLVKGGEWQAALKQLPRLHSLTLRSYRQVMPAELYDALRSVNSLRSLTAYSGNTDVNTISNGYPYTAHAALTQLRDLTLHTPWIRALDDEYGYEDEDEEELDDHPSMQGQGPAVLRKPDRPHFSPLP
jgi:hypothetical protein